MSDLTLREPMLPQLPGRDHWIVWTALASLMLHAGLLTFLLWQPLPESAEAPQPPAIDVELVPPPEAAGGSEQADEEPAEEEPGGDEAAAEQPAEAPSAQAPVQEQPSDGTATEPAAATAPTAEATSAEPAAQKEPSETAAEPAGLAAEPAEVARAEAPRQERTAEEAALQPPTEPETVEATEAPAGPTASEATNSAEPVPPQGVVDTAKVAPIPLSRPRVRGLTAESGAPEDGAATPADAADVAEGAVTAPTPEGPDVATLELGAERSADRFYLEAMLSTPRLARAREMLKTLPAEKRLAQTCNIEALAQIGYSGEGFTPDVVMAEAYALQEMIGTRLIANGAIFRSGEKWYGLAFDCTLSDDLSTVTAFTYRLGADVTEAVLARLERN